MNVGIYCLDQDHSTAASIGLYNYLKQLIAALATQPDPGFHVSLIVSTANRSDLVPPKIPEWIDVLSVDGNFSQGWHRLRADHLISMICAKRANLDAIHFPKGPIPLLIPKTLRVISTIADAIIFKYGKDFSSGISAPKRAYFRWMTKRSLRNASAVITISDFSRKALAEIAPHDRNKITTIYPGTGLPQPDDCAILPRNLRDGITVFGSYRPHKATKETLDLLAQYADRTGTTMKVNVVSIDHPDPSWLPLPSSLNVNFLGRTSDSHLKDLIRKSHALVYLSHLEGFGLPCIESYSAGTPACYRDTTALAEVMADLPCSWDGTYAEGFFDALTEAMSMSTAHIEANRRILQERFNWQNTAKRTLELYRNVLKDNRVRLGIIDVSCLTISGLLEEIRILLQKRSITPRTIACVNAHIYNLAASDTQLRQDLLNARVIAADGMSIVWASRLLAEFAPRSRCNMTDAFTAFLHEKSFPVTRAVIVGLTESHANKAMKGINSASTHCKVEAAIDGYLTDSDYKERFAALRDIDLVFVGMGSPRSERVVQIAAASLPHAIVWHVGGGTLSHFAGNTKLAPLWMRRTGIQWLHRLAQEPKRMFKRYILGNPRFALRIVADHLKNKARQTMMK